MTEQQLAITVMFGRSQGSFKDETRKKMVLLGWSDLRGTCMIDASKREDSDITHFSHICFILPKAQEAIQEIL